MIEIIAFDNFSKRKNSTKQPIDSDGTVLNVALKGECSLVNPSFFISGTTGWNYIKAFGLYYFVDRVAYDINGAQYINCSIDVLASWKPSILNTSAFVSFSTSNYNENIIDKRVTQRVTLTADATSQDAPFVSGVNTGSFIISVFDQVTGTSHYAINEEQLDDMVEWLFNHGQDFWSDLQIQFGDAMGSIIGIRYVPIDRESLYDSELGAWNINLGTFPTDTSGYLISGFYQDSTTLAIPWIYNDFRRCAKFTRFYLVLPFIGTVEINPENLIGATTLSIVVNCNVVTGSIIYVIRARGQIIATYTGEFGRQVATATDQIDSSAILNGAISLGSSAATLALGAGGVASIGAGIVTSILSATASGVEAFNRHDVQTIGGFGGGYGELAIGRYYLCTKALDTQTIPTELTELYGRPLNKVMRIGELSGYCETIGFAIDIPAVSEIRDLINSAMDKGVYIE